ncbi:hypothetical protein [Brevundimonas sp.]|uniref:hypothetical protein n=1 Tax=Brevundimonas sp. TaxID=1871086 RepID=UPI001AD4EBB9|nr:hypothetical protein [Brevundimonas sp.]MBN9466571.1 hypothetical protein [Brevundimonas sp.]
MKIVNLKTASLVLTGVGLLALARAVVFDTAPSGTHNIGLMQIQMLWAQFASTMLVVGAILFVGNHIAEATAEKTALEAR